MNNYDHNHLVLKTPNFSPQNEICERKGKHMMEIKMFVFKNNLCYLKTKCMTSNPPKKTNSRKHGSLKTNSRNKMTEV